MSLWVVIPVKARAACKSRLAPVLSPEKRLELVREMLRHVITIAAATPGIDRVAVVSPERDDVDENVLVLPEQEGGLNAALGRGIATIRSMGARRVIVLPADLPRLAVRDVEELLSALNTHGCALAPDWRETGTNAIALDLHRLGNGTFRFAFGKDSFARHQDEASDFGFAPKLVRSEGLAFDLDEPDDLRFGPWHSANAAIPVG